MTDNERENAEAKAAQREMYEAKDAAEANPCLHTVLVHCAAAEFALARAHATASKWGAAVVHAKHFVQGNGICGFCGESVK